jgi:hypothetical protein
MTTECFLTLGHTERKLVIMLSLANVVILRQQLNNPLLKHALFSLVKAMPVVAKSGVGLGVFPAEPNLLKLI